MHSLPHKVKPLFLNGLNSALFTRTCGLLLFLLAHCYFWDTLLPPTVNTLRSWQKSGRVTLFCDAGTRVHACKHTGRRRRTNRYTEIKFARVRLACVCDIYVYKLTNKLRFNAGLNKRSAIMNTDKSTHSTSAH